MNKFTGKVWVILQNIGSKSEGNFAYLQTEVVTYTLFRDGFREVNDCFFSEYADKNVIIEGEVMNNNWLVVNNIEVVTEEGGRENSVEKEIECNNEDMS